MEILFVVGRSVYASRLASAAGFYDLKDPNAAGLATVQA
jgi:hypothetical protein